MGLDTHNVGPSIEGLDSEEFKRASLKKKYTNVVELHGHFIHLQLFLSNLYTGILNSRRFNARPAAPVLWQT
jgi:hypothetical protein